MMYRSMTNPSFREEVGLIPPTGGMLRQRRRAVKRPRRQGFARWGRYWMQGGLVVPRGNSSPRTALGEGLASFRHYLQAERGLAVNTVRAYGRALDRFAVWVAGAALADYLRPSLRDLSHYVSFLRDDELAPPSVARHLVALK